MGDESSVDPTHSKDIDIMGLKLAQDMPDVKLYSLVEGSILADYVSLASIVNKNPMQIEDKAPDALKDFADLPPRPSRTFGPVRKFVDKYDLWPEYEKLKDNIYMHALYDLIDLIKMTPLVLKKILFRPRRKKT